MMENQYAERDAYELDVAGGYYCRHVSAMTREGLDRKGDIAAELGHRDMVIAELLEALKLAEMTLSKGRNVSYPEAYGAVNKLRAAISKALGQ